MDYREYIKDVHIRIKIRITVHFSGSRLSLINTRGFPSDKKIITDGKASFKKSIIIPFPKRKELDKNLSSILSN